MPKYGRVNAITQLMRDYTLIHNAETPEEAKEIDKEIRQKKVLTEKEKMIQLLKKFNINLITLNTNPDIEFSRDYYLNACLNLNGSFHDIIKRIHEQCSLIDELLNSPYSPTIFEDERKMLNKIRQIYLDIGLFLKHYMIQHGIK